MFEPLRREDAKFHEEMILRLCEERSNLWLTLNDVYKQ